MSKIYRSAAIRDYGLTEAQLNKLPHEEVPNPFGPEHPRARLYNLEDVLPHKKKPPSATKGTTLATLRLSVPNSHKEWSIQDDEAIALGFQQGKSLDELAAQFQRKLSAIQSRLFKLGLVKTWKVA